MLKLFKINVIIALFIIVICQNFIITCRLDSQEVSKMLTFFVVKFILGVFLPIMEEHLVYYLYILSEKACANNQNRS